MAIQIRKRKNGDKTTSLYLDIWQDGRRSYEFLSFKLIPGDGAHNKEAIRMAEEIRANRVKEYASGKYNISNNIGLKTSAISWMEKYAKNYDKADKRNIEGVLKRFKAFLDKEKKLSITFKQIDEKLVEEFRDTLIKTCEYSGSTSYFARFKKMMRAAAKELKFVNPALEVENKEAAANQKDTLTLKEIVLLANTPISNSDVRRAFLFCCCTGMAWCDVRELTWNSIKGIAMEYVRNKTKKPVRVTLNSAALSQLGERGKRGDYVFVLPTADGANKLLRGWVERAGIDKHITWHCARHSLGTNAGSKRNELLTIARLLGHTSTKHTVRYVHQDEELKKAATDSVDITL